MHGYESAKESEGWKVTQKAMEAHILALEARLNATTWQPIATAPKDGTLILAANIDPAIQNAVVIYWEPGSVVFNVIGHWRSSTHEIVAIGLITHWQPLPAAPVQP